MRDDARTFSDNAALLYVTLGATAFVATTELKLLELTRPKKALATPMVGIVKPVTVFQQQYLKGLYVSSEMIP